MLLFLQAQKEEVRGAGRQVTRLVTSRAQLLRPYLQRRSHTRIHLTTDYIDAMQLTFDYKNLYTLTQNA